MCELSTTFNDLVDEQQQVRGEGGLSKSGWRTRFWRMLHLSVPQFQKYWGRGEGWYQQYIYMDCWPVSLFCSVCPRVQRLNVRWCFQRHLWTKFINYHVGSCLTICRYEKKEKRIFGLFSIKSCNKICYIKYKNIYKINLKIVILLFTTPSFLPRCNDPEWRPFQNKSKLLIGHHKTSNFVIWTW